MVKINPAPVLGWPPGHFYSAIPDPEAIASDRERIFAWADDLPGIDLNDAGQVEFFASLVPHYLDGEFPERPGHAARYHYDNDNFRHGCASIYAALIRKLRPRRIIEAGSGYSSALALDVRDGMGGTGPRLTFIDPHPDLLRSLLRPGDEAAVEILPIGIQTADAGLFADLGPGDILFIDSTHVLKTDSDVCHHLFRILPALRPGVHVHFHDVYYPFEYPETWVMEGRAWNELYALRAFLQYNAAFEIRFFANYFAGAHRDLLASGMPAALKGPGSGLWLRKC